MKQALVKIFILSVAVLLAGRLPAQIRLNGIFGDSMVLQRDAPLRIWGKAGPGESITVKFHLQERKTSADRNGEWQVVLSPEKAGGPYTLNVRGKEAITLKGILMGDIWLCSGQSNMEFPVKGWTSVENADEEIKQASFPRIRLFTIEKNVQALPADELKGGVWQTCSPASIAPFSAVGYFFGRALQKDLNVPIGLINSTWGGTQVETWISHAGFENDPYFKDVIRKAPALGMDELLEKRSIREKPYLDFLQKGLSDVADSAEWKTAKYDDRSWSNMELPGVWEQQAALSRLDGVVWFRKDIYVDSADAGKAGSLRLAKIDDNDETYLNGTLIGSTSGWNMDRTYSIPEGVLKPGKNVIAVKVEDSGGGGGIYGESGDLFFTVNGHKKSLAGSWHYRVEKILHSSNGVGPNDYPSLLYNGMIHPFHQLNIKGVIWYQGEANAGNAYEYRQSLPLLISDWRNRFNNKKLPFYYVQLTSFNAGNGNSNQGSTWAELREAQAATLRVPQTGMAVTIDIGDAKDIHPRNKKDVGERLAAIVLQHTYGINKISSGPVYAAMKKAGQKMIIDFSSVGKGLMVKGSNELAGFEIAGSDRKFFPAKAVITGKSIEVSASEVANPVAVRYAWADDAGHANLFNKDGWPAAPFRTDNWPGITDKNKYDPSFK